MNSPSILALNALSAASNQNSAAIDASYLVECSLQGVVTTTALGTLKLQCSNERSSPTHWSNISGATVSVTGAGNFIIPKIEVSYQWLRAVYTDTFVEIANVTTVADVAGSLNNTYFLLSAANGGTSYYVWLNINSAGVDPAIAGKTGIEVDAATGASANAIATAIRSAFSGNPDFTASGATNQVILTQAAGGPGTALSDGAVPTGFTFATTVPTGLVTANLKAIGGS